MHHHGRAQRHASGRTSGEHAPTVSAAFLPPSAWVACHAAIACGPPLQATCRLLAPSQNYVPPSQVINHKAGDRDGAAFLSLAHARWHRRPRARRARSASPPRPSTLVRGLGGQVQPGDAARCASGALPPAVAPVRARLLIVRARRHPRRPRARRARAASPPCPRPHSTRTWPSRARAWATRVVLLQAVPRCSRGARGTML